MVQEILHNIVTKDKNRYKLFQVLPMYNAHSHCSFKNLGKKVHYTWQNIVGCITNPKADSGVLIEIESAIYNNQDMQPPNCPSTYE